MDHGRGVVHHGVESARQCKCMRVRRNCHDCMWDNEHYGAIKQLRFEPILQFTTDCDDMYVN